MRLTRKNRWLDITVVVFGLLALAAPASAECAWVLWQKSFSSRDIPHGASALWVVVNAHNNRNACEAALADSVAESTRVLNFGLSVFPSVGAEVTVGKNWVEEHKPEDSSWNAFHFFCLPDTVDPRGPKGTK